MVAFFVIVILIVCIVWIIGFFFINDFSIPNLSILHYNKILLIYPHADDEVLGTAGLINIASIQNKKLTLVILTKGEKGTPDASTDLRLKNVRVNEARTISKFLGISNLIQEDFGDGELIQKTDRVNSYISKLLDSEKPDLVVTYDESGLYGHPDHIVVSEIVTDLIKKKYTNTSLWYTTYPKRVLSMVSLPEHMAKDPKFKEKRVLPTNKLFIGMSLFKKIQSVYLYKSQYQSFRDGIPFKAAPLWFFYSMSWYEYFYQVKTS